MHNELPPHQLLLPEEVRNLFRISKAAFERRIAKGTIPPPIQLGQKIRRWRRSDIEKLIGEEWEQPRKPEQVDQSE